MTHCAKDKWHLLSMCLRKKKHIRFFWWINWINHWPQTVQYLSVTNTMHIGDVKRITTSTIERIAMLSRLACEMGPLGHRPPCRSHVLGKWDLIISRRPKSPIIHFAKVWVHIEAFPLRIGSTCNTALVITTASAEPLSPEANTRGIMQAAAEPTWANKEALCNSCVVSSCNLLW